ncbi:hypothetical protein Tco_1481034, partial [Tanacetum coccineum]
DTDEIYRRLDDAQDDRLLMSGQLNLLRRDRRSHARTTILIEGEARASREATTKIGDLRATDCRRQTRLTEALTLVRTLKTQMVALQSQQKPARDPTHPDNMPPRKAPRTRTTPATTTTLATITTTTTFVIDEQVNTLITQGVADVLAEREATRSRNGEDNHDSRIGVRRQAPLAHECTYPDFMKCKPLYFKGTKGVVELT